MLYALSERNKRVAIRILFSMLYAVKRVIGEVEKTTNIDNTLYEGLSLVTIVTRAS